MTLLQYTIILKSRINPENVYLYVIILHVVLSIISLIKALPLNVFDILD